MNKQKAKDRAKEKAKLKAIQAKARAKANKAKEIEDKAKQAAKLKHEASLERTVVSKKGKVQHLFRIDRVEQKLKEGWKKAKPVTELHGRVLGVKTHCDDLVLMER